MCYDVLYCVRYFSTTTSTSYGLWWDDIGILVCGRVTDIHWIADTWRVRVWIQICTHERKWVWVGFYLAGMDTGVEHQNEPPDGLALGPNCPRLWSGQSARVQNQLGF